MTALYGPFVKGDKNPSITLAPLRGVFIITDRWIVKEIEDLELGIPGEQANAMTATHPKWLPLARPPLQLPTCSPRAGSEPAGPVLAGALRQPVDPLIVPPSGITT